MITIFTPTFNRSDNLIQLFNSLLNQTNKNFEWIIIDDGSTDETKNTVSKFKDKADFNIIYLYQENKGKHKAINKGVSLAKGVLFFIVDSDDLLYANSIKILLNYYNEIKNNNNIVGLCGLKTFFNGEIVGGQVNFNDYIGNLLDFRYKKKVTGDKAEVFKTKILKKFPFPETDGEKFCPEALVWNRIANKYKFYFINQKIYKCEYLEDGLTSKITKIRAKSPYNTMLTYSELSKYAIPLNQKIKASINFWRFAFYDKKTSFKEKFRMLSFPFSFIGLLPGVLFYIFEKNKIS